MDPDLPKSENSVDESSSQPSLPAPGTSEKKAEKDENGAAETDGNQQHVSPKMGVRVGARASGQVGNSEAKRFFALSDRFPIQVFNDESGLQKLSHWGPTVTAIASFVLALFVWTGTRQLTNRQIELQSKQLDIQNQQAQREAERSEAEIADLRFKFLSDLTATDENRKTPAEIGLAAHGLKAFEVVHYALGVEQGDIRKSAVNVVYRLFQAQTEKGREELLDKLMAEFQFPNKTLHTGIVQSFVKVEPLLSPEQRRKLIGFVQQTAVPQNACSDQDGRELVFEAAKFIGSKRTGAIPYLLSVADVPNCGDGWFQAMYSLQSFAGEMSTEERADLRRQIEQVKKDVLDHLEQRVSKQDLSEGSGFTNFSKGNEVGITLDAFKKQVEKAFGALTSQLG